jgi:hypothetical protein
MHLINVQSLQPITLMVMKLQTHSLKNVGISVKLFTQKTHRRWHQSNKSPHSFQVTQLPLSGKNLLMNKTHGFIIITASSTELLRLIGRILHQIKLVFSTINRNG